MPHDYNTTRRHLIAAIEALEKARRRCGQVNLPPYMRPFAVRQQIEDVEALIEVAREDVAAAKQATAQRPKLFSVD